MIRPVFDFPIYFSRHGQTDWNAEHRLQGQADTDINALGKAQADENGRDLAALLGRAEGYDFVASPMRRTRETMERIRSVMGLDPTEYRTDPRLIELHFGDWQGFTYAELESSKPGSTAGRAASKWDFVPPGKGAENYEMLLARVGSWLSQVERKTVCVTHGGVVRTLFRMVGGYSILQAEDLDVPQDRILRYEAGRLEWIGDSKPTPTPTAACP